MGAPDITVTLALTGRCNYRCAHCYVSGGSGAYELGTDEMRKLIDLLADAGVSRVMLTGGEPLFRADFFELLRHMRKRGITVEKLATNGSLVDERFLETLFSLDQRPLVSVSYDGDDGAHDALRKHPGAGSLALRALSLCHEAGLHTASEMTLHAGNAGLLRKSILTLAAHGCESVKALPIFPVGTAKDSAAFRPLPPGELYSLFLAYISDYYADGMPVEVYLNGFFYARPGLSGYAVPMERFKNDASALSCAYCAHARFAPYLSADGRLLPCAALAGFSELTCDFPRLIDTGLDTAQNAPAFSAFLNHTVGEQIANNPDCAACEARFTCGGGCRIQPLSAQKNASDGFFGRDEYCCEYFKGNYHARIHDAVKLGLLSRTLTRS